VEVSLGELGSSREGADEAPTPVLAFIHNVADNLQMEIFRECWKRAGNDKRTATKDA
jgi:hypothetical protein